MGLSKIIASLGTYGKNQWSCSPKKNSDQVANISIAKQYWVMFYNSKVNDIKMAIPQSKN